MSLQRDPTQPTQPNQTRLTMVALKQDNKCLQGTWADRMNIQGQQPHLLIQGSTGQYSGNERFAKWIIGTPYQCED